MLYPVELGVHVERVEGIEPSSSAWKAVDLPLTYTRIWSEHPGSNRGCRLGGAVCFQLHHAHIKPCSAANPSLAWYPAGGRLPPITHGLQATGEGGLVHTQTRCLPAGGAGVLPVELHRTVILSRTRTGSPLWSEW